MSYVPPSRNSELAHPVLSSSVDRSDDRDNDDGFIDPRSMDEEELQLREVAGELAKMDQSEPARKGRLIMAMRAALGELFATCVLVYAACGSGIANNVRGNTTDTVTGTLVVSFVAMALIYSFSSISGCHMNPAVTLALWIDRKTSTRKLMFYVLAQLIGANVGMFFLFLSFDIGSLPKLNWLDYVAVAPAPGANEFSILFNEFVLTFILVFVILKVAFEDIDEQKRKTMSVKGIANSKGLTIFTANSQSKLGFAPLAIGFTIGTLGTLGPISGGCYNPARLLAPALWSGNWDYWYLYIIGEALGASAAAGVRYVFDKLAHWASEEQKRADALREVSS